MQTQETQQHDSQKHGLGQRLVRIESSRQGYEQIAEEEHNAVPPGPRMETVDDELQLRRLESMKNVGGFDMTPLKEKINYVFLEKLWSDLDVCEEFKMIEIHNKC